MRYAVLTEFHRAKQDDQDIFVVFFSYLRKGKKQSTTPKRGRNGVNYSTKIAQDIPYYKAWNGFKMRRISFVEMSP